MLESLSSGGGAVECGGAGLLSVGQMQLGSIANFLIYLVLDIILPYLWSSYCVGLSPSFQCCLPCNVFVYHHSDRTRTSIHSALVAATDE